jgi:glycosyltransferase involved in cell wall biosynthesis
LKYISYYKESGQDYRVVGWDRTNEGVYIENSILYQKKSGYRVGGFRAAYYRILWMLFVITKLIQSKEVSTIHACDLDTAFPAAIYKRFLKGKVKVIFDIFDWFSDNLSDQNKLIRSAFKFMENFTINEVDEIIICEPERREQIPYKLKKEPFVFPNIPAFSNYDFLKLDNAFAFDNNLITISYVGGFVYDRFLKELLLLADEHLVNILIAGYGEEDIEEKCRFLQGRDNFKYFGKVPYQRGLQIMYNSDCIYAMYCKVSRNNVYAAPNKYYESMLLGKPVISTKGTILEKKILANEMGYVIEEDYNELKNLVCQLERQDIMRRGQNAHKLWNEQFYNYTKEFLHNDYKKIIIS